MQTTNNTNGVQECLQTIWILFNLSTPLCLHLFQYFNSTTIIQQHHPC